MKKQNIKEKIICNNYGNTSEEGQKLSDTYELKWALLLKIHVAVKCIHLTWSPGARGM